VISPGFSCAACDGERVIKTSTTVVVCPICNGAGLIDEIEGDIVPPEQQLEGGWCIVFCKNRKVNMHKRIPIGPYRKPFGVWKDNPSGMIVKCAEADGLRSTFPTMLGGLYLREEIEMFPETPNASAPPPSFLGPVTDVPSTSEPRRSERSTVPEDDAPPGAEVPPKTTAAAPPAPAEASPAETQGEQPAVAFVSMTTEAASALTGKALLEAVRGKLNDSECTEEQLTAWARAGMQAKSDQQWFDISEGKLRNILTKWSAIGPNVKAAKA
jgi:hypothetical protein